MSLFSDLVLRLRAILFRGRMERELDEEFETHVMLEAEARRQPGISTDEARRQALLAFGGLDRWKEATRDARGVALLDGFGLDLRQSFRSLRRNPGFTAAVVLVLGLGIGVTATVFGVVRTVLFSQLPYPAADRLVRIYQQNSPTNLFGLSTVDVQAIEAEQRSFDAFGAVQRAEAALSGVGPPERVIIGRASAGFFRALAIEPVAGRLVTADDQRPEAPAVAVVGYRLAERVLGGATAAVGRTVTLDGVTHTVIGVLPRRYTDLAGVQAEAWPALRLVTPTRRGPFRYRGIGRLRPGVTVLQAAAELAEISDRTYPQWASSFRDQRARLTPYPLRRTIVGDAGRRLTLLTGAVVLVLLVAIANVATLTLVRASARGTELAVRNALGAGRVRLVRLLLTENALLALGAVLTGLGVAWGFMEVLRRQTDAIPRVAEVAFDGPTALALFLLALAAGLLITLSPISSLLLRRLERPVSARTGTAPGDSRARSLLVVGEFALALPLLFGAGLLLNSFVRLSRVDPGFDPRGVIAVNLALPSARYPDPAAVERFLTQAESRAGELAGGTSAGLSNALPPDDPGDVNNFDLLDQPVPAGVSEPVAAWSAVTPGYFAALRIPLREGRLFEPGDTAGGPPVVVVSQAWATRYYGPASAVGRQLYSGGCRTCTPSTVIGVVGDVKYLGLSGSSEAVYESVKQAGPRQVNLILRTADAGAESRQALRAALAALDPELPLRPLLLEDRVRDSLSDPRRWMSLVTAFAAVAAGLAAFGVYGLMSYLVRQRRREIGVRIALGADPARVTRDVIRRGLGYAGAGSLAGGAVALAGGGWVREMLYGVTPRDPITLLAVVTLVLGMALVSSWLPGRRAARMHLPATLGGSD